MGMLRKLLSDEIRTERRTNLVQGRRFRSTPHPSRTALATCGRAGPSHLPTGR